MSELKRSVARWAICSPTAMAHNQSRTAIYYALNDAKSDILELHKRCLVAAKELSAIANELKLSSTVGGEWDGTEEAAREEYDRLMVLVKELTE